MLIFQKLVLRAIKPLDLVMGLETMYHSKYFSLSPIDKLKVKQRLRVEYNKVVSVWV